MLVVVYGAVCAGTWRRQRIADATRVSVTARRDRKNALAFRSRAGRRREGK